LLDTIRPERKFSLSLATVFRGFDFVRFVAAPVCAMQEPVCYLALSLFDENPPPLVPVLSFSRLVAALKASDAQFVTRGGPLDGITLHVFIF